MTFDYPFERRRLPKVWGEGTVFAYSGLTGETSAVSQFSASLAAEPGRIHFETPQRRLLRITFPSTPQILGITHDTMVVRTATGDGVLAWAAWHTLLGEMPPATLVDLDSDFAIPGKFLGVKVSRDSTGKDVLALAQHEGRFCLAFGATQDEARRRALAGLPLSPVETAQKNLEYYDRLPGALDEPMDRLLRKCYCVLAANTLAAEGKFSQAWAVPSRAPCRQMIGFDAVFHSMGLNLWVPDQGWEVLASLLANPTPDGHLPHRLGPDGKFSDLLMPPLAAWAMWENHRAKPDQERLQWALPQLEAHLQWVTTHRDLNKNKLVEWKPPAASGQTGNEESGMENSPRFDTVKPHDAVDFSTYTAHDMLALVRLLAAGGQMEKAEQWQRNALEISGAIHRVLWNDKQGFYFDRNYDNEFSSVVSAAGFLPMLLPSITPARATRMVKRLEDPAQFAAAAPVPTVALSHPAYSNDWWRGGTHPVVNYLIIRGLRQHGRKAAAEALARQTLAFVHKEYEQTGVLWEFYDAKGETSPRQLPRKGPAAAKPDWRKRLENMRDHSTTAAVVALLIHDYFEKYDPNFS